MSENADAILDVRSELRGRRHELVFDRHRALSRGSAFVLVNNRDPKPLRHQFDAECAGGFSWDYVERSLDIWRVRIGRAT